MKNLFRFLVSLALLAVMVRGAQKFLAWVDVPHEHEHAEGHDKDEKSEEHEEAHVKIDKEARERLGLKVEAVKAATFAPGIEGLGVVLDPAPLLALFSELRAAEIAMDLSRRDAERQRELFGSGENASRKVLEAANAQALTDVSKFENVVTQINVQWGKKIALMKSADRNSFITSLVEGEIALARIEPLTAASFEPKLVHLRRAESAGEEVTAEIISTAAQVDAKTQSIAWLVHAKASEWMKPGLAVQARFDVDGEAEKGVLIPEAAIVRHNGGAWVYVEDEDEFVRMAVDDSHQMKGGCFAKEPFTTEMKVVVTGAQALLSTEIAKFAPEED